MNTAKNAITMTKLMPARFFSFHMPRLLALLVRFLKELWPAVAEAPVAAEPLPCSSNGLLSSLESVIVTRAFGGCWSTESAVRLGHLVGRFLFVSG